MPIARRRRLRTRSRCSPRSPWWRGCRARWPGSPAKRRATFAQVLSVMEKRGLSLGRDPGDPYVQGLQALVRQPARERLLDRLLVSALIEARSEERLALLGANLPDPELRRVYSRLSGARKGHRELFLRVARPFEGVAERAAPGPLPGAA